jgi:hypothetical protein
MGLWQRLTVWRDERNALAQHHYDLEEADSADNPGDVAFYSDLIDQLETRQKRRAAWRYGVPIPPTPSAYESDKYWNWCLALGEHHLTTEGHAHLRREIAHERELLYKPWMSWLALGISFVSLAISAANWLSK